MLKDKKEKYKTSFGYRYLQHDSSVLSSELALQVTKGWHFRVYNQFDFGNGKNTEREFAVTRGLHCWEVEVGLNRSGPYGQTVFVIFRMKAFPDIPIGLRKSFPRPVTLGR